MLHRWACVVVSRPGIVLGVVFVLSLVASAALVDTKPIGFNMSLDPSEEPLMPEGDPAREVYRQAVRTFGDDDLYVIGVQTPGLFTAANLGVLDTVSYGIRRIEGVRRTQSVVNATDYRYVADRDMVEVGDFIAEIPTDRSMLNRLRERATSHPLYEHSIVSSDGKTGAINVSFRQMSDGEFVAARIDERITTLVRAHENGERRFFVTGRQHIKARAHRIMVDDLLLLIPLAVMVGALIAWILAGSLLSGVLPVATSLVATLWVFGLLAWLGRPLNLITIVFGPTLICVGSVYGVHVMALHRDFLIAGNGPRAAASACLVRACGPLLIAGTTTAIGFGALALSDTPAIRELGWFCVSGVSAVTVLSLTALPALLGTLPASALRVGAGIPAAILSRCLHLVATLVRRNSKAVLVLWGLVTSVALVCLPRIVVDSDYLTFFDPESDVRRDFASVSESLVGAVPLYVTVEGGVEGAFREPVNLRAVERLQRLIEVTDGVSAVTSIVDLVRTANRVIEKDDPAADRIPDSRGEVADVMFLIPKNELRRFANSNHSSVNIVVRTGLSGSSAILALERNLREAIVAAGLPADLRAEVTGNAIVVNHGAEGIARNQFATIGAATATIFLIVTVAFGSWRVGLLAMIPNLVPVIMFFGVLGTGIATLSLPTSLIGCIALGIAIDDTAHFLVGYRRRRREGMTPADASADCINTLGRPIVTTSLMLIAGFSVLSFSGFATLRQFGHLTALTMFVCLLADLLLLPAVLIRARV